MCEYFGKKKLYQLLKCILEPDKVSSMKKCYYSKYRGSEWLVMYIDYDYEIKIFHSGRHLSIDFYLVDDYDDTLRDIDRMCFCISDKEFVVDYWRNNSNIFVPASVREGTIFSLKE